MPCTQFSIRALLWLTLVVAAFLGGIKFGAWRERQASTSDFTGELAPDQIWQGKAEEIWKTLNRASTPNQLNVGSRPAIHE
jgi:hypothetical protein